MLREGKIEFEIIFYFSANVVVVAFPPPLPGRGATVCYCLCTDAETLCSPGFHIPHPAGQFLPAGSRDGPGITRVGANKATKFTPRPPARSKVHLGTGTPLPAPPVPGAQDGGGGGGSHPSAAHTRALETQFPLSVKQGYSQKAVMSIQCNQCAKSLKCNGRDQVTMLPGPWSHTTVEEKGA